MVPEEIMEAYPHSKFILPKVDLDEWIQSYQNFFKKMIIPKILNSTEEFEAYGMNKASAYVAVQHLGLVGRLICFQLSTSGVSYESVFF